MYVLHLYAFMFTSDCSYCARTFFQNVTALCIKTLFIELCVWWTEIRRLCKEATCVCACIEKSEQNRDKMLEFGFPYWNSSWASENSCHYDTMMNRKYKNFANWAHFLSLSTQNFYFLLHTKRSTYIRFCLLTLASDGQRKVKKVVSRTFIIDLCICI